MIWYFLRNIAKYINNNIYLKIYIYLKRIELLNYIINLKEDEKIAYRGPALTYKIKKVTSNNKTGDSYAITVPRIIAQKFEEYLFRMVVSGNSIIFESGCKLTVSDIEASNQKKIFIGGGTISFK